MGGAKSIRQRVRLDGDAALKRRLDALRKSVRTKIQKQAVNAGGTVVLQAARRKVPVRYGDLKKSLGKKGKVSRRQAAYLVVIGPRRGRKRKRGDQLIDPVRYAHLVEFGTVHSKPKPFMRPALDEHKPEVMAAIEDNMRKGIAREAAKKR